MTTPEKIILGTPAGQRPLLDEPPCNCEGDAVSAFLDSMADATFAGLNKGGVCTIAASTALMLVAGSLVNPVNVTPKYREATCQAARIIADTMEQIARRIRERASD